MDATACNWSISIDAGLSLDGEKLLGAFATHHRRLLATWQGFDPAHWESRSRNREWTVHQTVRHVADAMERGATAVNGEPTPGVEGFDPRSTPDAWLAASAGESPEAAIERFAAASTLFRSGISERFASGDDSHDRTVFGTAHWTVNVAHLLWDSWLHERDVLLPLGQPARSTEEEERLVALYGIMMALVPTMMFEQSISARVQLIGIGPRTIEVSCGAGSLRSVEVPAGAAPIAGALSAAVDALAGRGDAVADVLPGAPEALGFLAAYFNS